MADEESRPVAEKRGAKRRREATRGTQWLTKRQRGVAGVIGVAGLATGAVATFESSNSLGTLGLQVIGGVFAFLGVTGLIPKRLTVGGNSVEYGDFAEDVVQEALQSPEPEVREAVARQVLATADSRGPEMRGSEDAREAKRLVDLAKQEIIAGMTLDAIERNLPEGTVLHETGSGSRHRAFGRPGAPRSGQVHVTVMWAGLRSAWVQNYVKAARRRSGYGAYVYVGPGSKVPRVVSMAPPLLTASWETPSDDPDLRVTLAAALRVAETGEDPPEEWFADRRTLDLN